MAKEQRLFTEKHPSGTFTAGVKQGGDLTVYKYTKERLSLIGDKIQNRSALEYPLLEPEDH